MIAVYTYRCITYSLDVLNFNPSPNKSNTARDEYRKSGAQKIPEFVLL